MDKNLFAQARSKDLLGLVQKYTGQRGKGAKTMAFFCPRHKERTPSLMVNTITNTWHCFGGCAVGGDACDFVEFVEFGSVSKGAMNRLSDGSLDKTAPRYKALEILMGNLESTYVTKPIEREAIDFTSTRRIVSQESVILMHNNRVQTLDYFVGKRKLKETTVDERFLGTAFAYPHWFKWADKDQSADVRFECIRYSIPWMRKGRPYMVNYRRDDADCVRRLGLLDPEYVYDIRCDICKKTDYSARDITDEQVIRYLYGDKYIRNTGSVGFTIFNLDRIIVPNWMAYCTVNEAEISTISCEESGLYSVAASYKYAIDFKKAFSRVHQPIIFADNDGGTGLEKAAKLAEAISNPRTLIKLVPAPFKDLADLISSDKVNGTNHLMNLKKEIGVI